MFCRIHNFTIKHSSWIKQLQKKLCLMLLFCYNENDEIGIYWGNKTFKVPEQVFLFVFSTPLVSV